MPSIENLKTIRYHFRFPQETEGMEETERIFTVFLEKNTYDLVQAVDEEKAVPEWAELSYNQCTNCPLNADEFKYCPTARALVEVVEFFEGLPSFQKVAVEVETDHRTYVKETSIQEGLQSLMGLIMPTSGCPTLTKLRPMALLHTPFGSKEETILKSIGMHFIRQYLDKIHGREVEFSLDNLVETYESIHKVNLDFIKRLKAASSKDAALNGLVNLDIFTMVVPRSIEKNLRNFLGVFSPELDNTDDTSCCGS